MTGVITAEDSVYHQRNKLHLKNINNVTENCEQNCICFPGPISYLVQVCMIHFTFKTIKQSVHTHFYSREVQIWRAVCVCVVCVCVCVVCVCVCVVCVCVCVCERVRRVSAMEYMACADKVSWCRGDKCPPSWTGLSRTTVSSYTLFDVLSMRDGPYLLWDNGTKKSGGGREKMLKEGRKNKNN